MWFVGEEAVEGGEYLVFDQISSPVYLDDVPDYELRTCLEKVCFLFTCHGIVSVCDITICWVHKCGARTAQRSL